jgi:hypothetical protein
MVQQSKQVHGISFKLYKVQHMQFLGRMVVIVVIVVGHEDEWSA